MGRYLRPVQAVAASFLTEAVDVEDAVQETFLRTIAGIGGYRQGSPFAPWIYQIARNAARTRLAAARRRPTEPISPDEYEEPSPGPEDAAERAEIRGMVDAALEALPEQRRIAFRLHDVEGYDTAEVARLMGLTSGTVRSHVHHARRALRAALAPRLGEEPTARDGRGTQNR